ncbi:MAG: hypothetical protein ACXVQY_05715 [Actinomycetota bacterium]
MVRRRTADERFQDDLNADPTVDTPPATSDDLRVRREEDAVRPAEPDVVPAPQEPIDTPATLPEIDGRTAVYGRMGHRLAVVRGGVSLPAILTGTLVAMGAMVIFMAITAGLLAATGVVTSSGVGQNGSVVRATVLTGVGLVLAQFLAYLWGGYTAGRMARGAGAANGFLVPLVAILVGVGIGVLVGYLGTSVHLNTPFQTARLPIDRDLRIHLGEGIAAAGLLAMFVGGIVGGVRGVWWHRKLEAPVLTD